jgi:hypothetical protein
MVVFNYSGKEINAKVVYYGPGLSGKTTNLEFIYDKTAAHLRGKMVSMKTKADRTLFFDFLPIEGGEIAGFKIRFLLYTTTQRASSCSRARTRLCSWPIRSPRNSPPIGRV